MGACPGCGKPKVRKNKAGVRRCLRCGVLPTGRFLDRAGQPRPHKTEPMPAVEALPPAPASGQHAPRLKVKWRANAAAQH